jgi:HEAT repeat protein
MVLRELAERAGFELVVAEGVALPPLSARINGLSLDEALPIVVGALDYRVERVFDPARAAHEVRRVALGSEEPTRVAAATPPESASPGWQRIQELRDRLEPGPRLAEVFDKLESSDPDARADAAAELEPSEDELELLRALLEDDPDPAVRIVAAEQLAGAGSYGANQALLGALGDRDPGVVVAAVEALASSNDASMIPQLAPLLEHREPAVRAAATLAIESLSD